MVSTSSIKIGELSFEAQGPSEIALINTACPWASDLEDLLHLYKSPGTSGITTRTALLSATDPLSNAFKEDPLVHTVKFLPHPTSSNPKGSINSYGFSPHPLSCYLSWICELFLQTSRSNGKLKPVILSITGPPEAIEQGIILIRRHIHEMLASFLKEKKKAESLVGVEINTSCPNIRGISKPAGYDPEMMLKYLEAIDRANHASMGSKESRPLSIGLKLPPYTYASQFQSMVSILSNFGSANQPRNEKQGPHPIAFLTSSNTLGSSMWFSPDSNQGTTSGLSSYLPTSSVLGFQGLGGLAGESLHPLSLGNVFQLRNLLDQDEDSRLKEIVVIGAGGVVDSESCLRMKTAGAGVVGLATALGRDGVEVFEKIQRGLGGTEA